MAKPDPLRRLGGGRWETKDGRFQIEPQSGTWVIVDTTQTNEFGLPLVRGPYGSLGAAREAIETARESGPVESPLADRLEKTRAKAPSKAVKPKADARPGEAAAAEAEAAEPEPEPPPEPKWIRDLRPVDRKKATELIARLESLGIDTAEAVARAEVANGQPAVTRLAIERQIRAAIESAKDPPAAAAAVVKLLLVGEDDDLEVRWRLVDDRGRPIEKLDLDD